MVRGVKDDVAGQGQQGTDGTADVEYSDEGPGQAVLAGD